MKESELEARLVRGVKALGGKAYKFISPGNVGVPDRIVILPGGRIVFAELKTENGRLTLNQTHQINTLRHLGVEAWEVRGAKGVADALSVLRERLQDGDKT